MRQYKHRKGVLVAALLLFTAAGTIIVIAQDEPRWDEALDAVVAAPDSHRVLLENAFVRVLEVKIRPGEREPAHTHRWPSVMVGLESARIRYYDANGKLRFETPAGRDLSAISLDTNWLRPEPLHAVENFDTVAFRALRVELKKGVSG